MMRQSTIEAEISIAKFLGEEPPPIPRSPKATPGRYEMRQRKAEGPKESLCFYKPTVPLAGTRDDCKAEVLDSHLKTLAYIESTA